MNALEKVRAEVERRRMPFEYGGETPDEKAWRCLGELLAFIDSLENEPTDYTNFTQKEVHSQGYDEAYLKSCIAKAKESWKGVDVDKYMDMVRGKEPVADQLEEAARQYGYTYCADWPGQVPAARDGFIAGANWQADQFEKNHLAHCDGLTKEQYDREMEFSEEIIDKEHRHPTFSDAIEYGMRIQREKDEKLIALAKDSWYRQGVIDGQFKGLTDDEKYQQGRFDMKEQMMKGAVEGFIFQSADYYPKELIARYEGDMKMGDKVKLIIVKED